MMKRYMIIHLIILMPAIILVATYAKEFIVVDKCLDAGGSYNYMAGECDFNISHQVLPFNERHSLLYMVGIFSGIIGAAGLFITTNLQKGIEASKTKRKANHITRRCS
jgi:uncharacterized membrane protein YciS (DUF1049 family)